MAFFSLASSIPPFAFNPARRGTRRARRSGAYTASAKDVTTVAAGHNVSLRR
jgi:hypothetical protein